MHFGRDLRFRDRVIPFFATTDSYRSGRWKARGPGMNNTEPINLKWFDEFLDTFHIGREEGGRIQQPAERHRPVHGYGCSW